MKTLTMDMTKHFKISVIIVTCSISFVIGINRFSYEKYNDNTRNFLANVNYDSDLYMEFSGVNNKALFGKGFLRDTVPYEGAVANDESRKKLWKTAFVYHPKNPVFQYLELYKSKFCQGEVEIHLKYIKTEKAQVGGVLIPILLQCYYEVDDENLKDNQSNHLRYLVRPNMSNAYVGAVASHESINKLPKTVFGYNPGNPIFEYLEYYKSKFCQEKVEIHLRYKKKEEITQVGGVLYPIKLECYIDDDDEDLEDNQSNHVRNFFRANMRKGNKILDSIKHNVEKLGK